MLLVSFLPATAATFSGRALASLFRPKRRATLAWNLTRPSAHASATPLHADAFLETGAGGGGGVWSALAGLFVTTEILLNW